jgi:hypothetical protein
MTLSTPIETDPLLFGKLMETGLNDFVLRQNLVMASIADLLRRVATHSGHRGTNSTPLLPHFRIGRPRLINISFLFVAAPEKFF